MREYIRQSGLEKQAKYYLNKIGIKDRVVEEGKLESYVNNMSDEDKAAFESNTPCPSQHPSWDAVSGAGGGIKWEDFLKAHKTAMDLRKGYNPSPAGRMSV